MGLLRKCALLCLWGVIVLTARAAPATSQSGDRSSKDTNDPRNASTIRNWWNLIPCFSSVQGYGLCDDRLFKPTNAYKQDQQYGELHTDEFVNYLVNHPVPGNDGVNIHSYPSHPYRYPSIQNTPYGQDSYPDFSPQNIVADQLVVFYNTPPEKYLNIQPSPNIQQETATEKPVGNMPHIIDLNHHTILTADIDERQSSQIGEKVVTNDGNSSAGPTLNQTHSSDVNETLGSDLSEKSAKMDKEFQRVLDILEKVAAALQQASTKTPRNIDLINLSIHNKTNSPKDLVGRVVTNDGNSTAGPALNQTLPNNVNEIFSSDLSEKSAKMDKEFQKVLDILEKVIAALEQASTKSPQNIDQIKLSIHTKTNSLKDFLQYIETLTSKLDKVNDNLGKVVNSSLKIASDILNKPLDSLNDKDLVNRLVLREHTLINERVARSSLEKLTNLIESGNTNLESTVDELFNNSSYNKDSYEEVIKLDKIFYDFGENLYQLFKNNATSQDVDNLLNIAEKLSGVGLNKSESKDLANQRNKIFKTYRNITTNDIQNLSSFITSLLKSDVTKDQIKNLTVIVKTIYEKNKNISDSDFIKAKNSAIKVAKTINDVTISKIFHDKQLRQNLTDFSTIVKLLLKEGVTKQLLDNLGKKIEDVKNVSTDIIANYLIERNLNRIKREVENKDIDFDHLDKFLEKDKNLLKREFFGKICPESFSRNPDDVNIELDESTPKHFVYKVTETLPNIREVTIKNGDIKKREIKDNVLPVHKNEFYDIMDNLSNNHTLKDSIVSAEAYFDKADELIRSGVEPIEILKSTISNILLLTSQVIEKTKDKNMGKHVHNEELYELLEDVLNSNCSESSVDAFFKKLRELHRTKHVCPSRLKFNVAFDLFVLVLRQLRN